jgi:hypothetical protein
MSAVFLRIPVRRTMEFWPSARTIMRPPARARGANNGVTLGLFTAFAVLARERTD